MSIIPSNAKIRWVKRAGSVGLYGPEQNVVLIDLWCRVDWSTRLVQDANGRSVTIDGTVILPGRHQLLPDDVITMDSKFSEQYTVFDAREERDIFGTVQNRVYRLVKRAEEIPSP